MAISKLLFITFLRISNFVWHLWSLRHILEAAVFDIAFVGRIFAKHFEIGLPLKNEQFIFANTLVVGFSPNNFDFCL